MDSECPAKHCDEAEKRTFHYRRWHVAAVQVYARGVLSIDRVFNAGAECIGPVAGKQT